MQDERNTGLRHFSVAVIWDDGKTTSSQTFGDRAKAIEMANGWIDSERTTDEPRKPVAVVLGVRNPRKAEVIVIDRTSLSFGKHGRAR